MDTLELASAVKLLGIHWNTDFICFRLDLLICGIKKSSRSEIDYLSNLILIKGSYKIPDFRIDAECIV